MPEQVTGHSQPGREPFSTGRNGPCFCGSGKRFKHCCGSARPDRPPPHGLVVLQEFATPAECQAILGVARTRPAERLKLMDREKSTEERVVRKYDENRITHRVDMGEQQTLLDTLVLRAIRTQIEPGLGVRFDWFEEPHLLQYGPGGLYHQHADSENFDAATDRWERAQDRDTSLLIYLDEDYEGGELHFPNFDFTLRPKPGTLVYFPSDHRYLHAAREVTAGQRHAIVSWLAQTGVDKLRPPPDDAIML